MSRLRWHKVNASFNIVNVPNSLIRHMGDRDRFSRPPSRWKIADSTQYPLCPECNLHHERHRSELHSHAQLKTPVLTKVLPSGFFFLSSRPDNAIRTTNEKAANQTTAAPLEYAQNNATANRNISPSRRRIVA